MKRTSVSSALSGGIKRVLEGGVRRQSGRVKSPKAKKALKIPQPPQPAQPAQPMQPMQPPQPGLPY